MRPLRVVVADDSSFFRDVLREVLEAERDIEVVAEAADGLAAVQAVSRCAPDLVTLDLRMPGMDGLAAVEEIMSASPAPILVLTAQASGPDGSLVFEAIRRGALGVWEKRQVSQDLEGGSLLRAQVRQLAGVRVVRHARARSTPAPGPASGGPSPPRSPQAPRPPSAVVGIGASAGGPAALAAVLGALPRDLRACVAVVQHIPPGFASSFESFVRQSTALRVVRVGDRARAEPGTVLLPADGRHLVATAPDTFAAFDGPPERGHRPSVDVLFFSLARVFGASATGVVLSGMGDDGARGLAAMKARGALTLAQDEATSVVWGMPRAAIELKVIDQVLPLGELAGALCGGR